MIKTEKCQALLLFRGCRHARPDDRLLRVVGGALIVLLGSQAQAATIRLDDQTTVEGDVVRESDDGVFIRLPRERVVSIDGRPLPALLTEGVPAPAFSATDLQGRPRAVNAADDRASVLFFWTSWCPYCRTDAPQVQALQARYQDNPHVQVLTVSLDDSREKLDAYLQEHQLSFPVVHSVARAEDGTDPASLYQVDGFPVTYVIDRQGVIRRKISGSAVRQGIDLAAEVEPLLAAR